MRQANSMGVAGLIALFAACGDEAPEGGGNGGASANTVVSSAATMSSTGASNGGGGSTSSASVSGGQGPGASTSSASGGNGPAASSSGGSACNRLSDDFDDASTLSTCWSQLHLVVNGPAQHDVLDINTSTAGHLVIEPQVGGWYQDSDGPFVFKQVSGDFVMEIHVATRSRSNPTQPPSNEYNSAGIIVRDPTSDNTPSGNENWLMYNLGFQSLNGPSNQSVGIGTEHKTTVNSSSVLTLTPGYHRGRLRMCRVGNEFRVFKWLDNESGWTEEASYMRADLPATLQAGVVANAWMTADLHSEFDYVRFGNVSNMADCTQAIQPI